MTALTILLNNAGEQGLYEVVVPFAITFSLGCFLGYAVGRMKKKNAHEE